MKRKETFAPNSLQIAGISIGGAVAFIIALLVIIRLFKWLRREVFPEMVELGGLASPGFED
jgi:undecaprenyl pyrophosphate phosphatase UppP